VDIDSVRNGLFLNKTGRSAFGLDIAVLMVRAVRLKFGQSSTMSMGSDDINIELDATETRFMAHLFDASYPCVLPTGPVVHVPNDLADWPPAVLFDAAYASAVVPHFNALSQGFLDKPLWRKITSNDRWTNGGSATSGATSSRTSRAAAVAAWPSLTCS
jgi:hypothetical protein